MSDTKHPISLQRRTFCAGTLGFVALGPLGLAGCGGGGESTAAATPAPAPALATSSAPAPAPSNEPPSQAAAPLSPSGAFVHPGLLHTQADFDRISLKVGAQASPWIDDWRLMLQNNLASNTWKPAAQQVVYRNDGVHSDNVQYLQWDVMAAYLNALQWKITGNITAADTAVKILNAWATTLTGINLTDGHWDGYLAAGLQGYQFANAAEIMRSYPGWAAADIAAFQQMMLKVFYPLVQGFNSLQVFSNWDLSSLAAAMAIGVLCDDRAKFDTAVARFQQGLGNGAIAQMVFYMHPGYLGQTQESGRDQGHNMLSVALVGTICEMAWNQGIDLYGYDNNRVLAACEYSAKGNLIESGTNYYSVPFEPYYVPGFYATAFSTSAIGNKRPAWALIYNHYVNRKGLAAPYSKKYAELVAPEVGGHYSQTGGTWDQLGYGTLLFTRDPIANGAPPSGLTAVTTAGQVVLSWWGSAYASSYNVKRSRTPGGPYAVVANGISDLLTYTDAGHPGGTCYYVVTANTPNGETPASNEVAGIAGSKLHTWLKFDEGSGTAAADASGNSHPGALTGGAAWTTGRQGSALSLNGSGAYLSLPSDIMSNVGDFTIAAWVYWNGSQNWARVFDFGSNTLHYMFLSPRNGSGALAFAASLNGHDSEARVEAPTPLPAAQWVHVAVTLSGRNLVMYLNGASIKTGDVPFPPFQIGRMPQSCIGRSQFPNDPTFNGMIDDFRIYNGALSAGDVAALSGTSLPAPMFSVDVGTVGLKGSASFANGVYTLQGGGADMWGNSDGLHFASSCKNGDFTITARVASQANTNSWSKSGVMMRSTLDGNASHVMLVVTPGNGVQMACRASTGGGTSPAGAVTGRAAPCWLRLARAGATVTGSISQDGVNWTQVGSANVSLPDTLFAGLATCSHDIQQLNTSTFDNVSIA